MSPDNRPRLRVGVLVDTLSQPAWIRRVIQDVREAAFSEIVLVVENGFTGRSDDRRSTWRKLRDHQSQLAYIAYRKLDSRLFRPKPDAFRRDDITPLLDGCPVLRVTPRMTAFSDRFPDESVEEILTYRLDVAIRFGFRILRGSALTIARHGVWSYHHGDNLVNRGGPAGFWEVLERHPTTGTVLQVLGEDLDNGRVIYRSFAKTDPKSVARNRNNYYSKSSAFVGRKLRELYENGGRPLEPDPLDVEFRPYAAPLYKKPSNARMLRLVSGLARRTVTERIDRALTLKQWMIAYKLRRKSGTPETSFHRLTPIVPPKDRFWADPFPVLHDGRYFIFIEELLYARGKGWISVAELDEKGRWQTPSKVLERDYHLSYPCVFRWQDAWYMIPETQSNRTIELYRCEAFPGGWTRDRVLFENVDAVDATVAEVAGLLYMFVNIAEPGALNYDELHVFSADRPEGPWTPHPRNPVKSDVRSARPAGRLFRWNDTLYRPAQDCSVRYGHSIAFNAIEELDRTRYRERVISRIGPTWLPGLVATHTYNSEGGLTVVDGRLRRSRFGS